MVLPRLQSCDWQQTPKNLYFTQEGHQFKTNCKVTYNNGTHSPLASPGYATRPILAKVALCILGVQRYGKQ